jgi:tetratricopeptide (TPR) repeat protein
LHGIGDFAGAVDAYKDAIRVDPRNAYAHAALGRLYLRRGDLRSGIAAYREALRLYHSDASSHYELAWALSFLGDREAEIAAWRDGVRAAYTPRAPEKAANEPEEGSLLNDDILSVLLSNLNDVYYGTPLQLYCKQGHIALGTALAEAGDHSGAVAEFNAAIRDREGDNLGKIAAYTYVGSTLRMAGDPARAIAAYRDAIRLAKEDGAAEIIVEARVGLGMALVESGELRAAMNEFRQAAPDEFRLIWGIVMARDPDRTIDSLRRVRTEVPNERAILDAIDLAIGRRKQILERGVKIPRIFCYSFLAKNLAEYCYQGHFFGTSASIWSNEFEMNRKLAEDVPSGNRYNAACSAALASGGRGFDGPAFEEHTKARWRRQAHDWLRADLAYWTRPAETREAKPNALVSSTLQHWRDDPDLQCVRDEKELERIPEPERKEWQKLWSEVAALLKSVEKP